LAKGSLIVGYGNPLRSDDGFGWYAAQQLASQLQEAEVEVIARHQLTPELAETASHFQLIIFIDAASDLAPGEVRCVSVARSEKREAPGASGFSHFLTPESLLDWTAELYGQFPEAYIIAVGGESFDDGESISAAMQGAFEPVMEQVRALLAGAAR